MAEQETDQESGQENAGNGKKNIIMFSIALVVAIGASVGGTMFFLGGTEEAPEAAAPTNLSKPETAIYHNMRPPYVINYLTGAKPRYLQAEFTVMARDEDTIEAIILHMPLIRSQIVGFLTEQNFLELQTHEGKESVRMGMLDLVNNILRSYEVKHGIESVLITNFVLQ